MDPGPVRVYINERYSRKVRILSGVRQGNPLSCSLFTVVIEGLACCILAESRLSGALAGSQIIKVLMYADETLDIIRTQEELNLLLGLLVIYGLASGSRINWEKCYLLITGGLPITIPGVQAVTRTSPYKHLGIPIGTDMDEALKVFWDGMLLKFEKIANQWLRYHLSMKGRILVANSLMLSIPRYAMRFLEIPPRVRKAMEASYH